MKTGKFIPMGFHQNIKIGYGTIDYKNLKTVYITLNSWVSPGLVDDYDQIISKTRNGIRHYLYNLENNFFKKESIVDLDIRTKGVKLEKKSFMNLEITLFVQRQFDIKEKEVKGYIKNLSESIIDNHLTDKNLFNFHKNKK
jgi:hypothetical protein